MVNTRKRKHENAEQDNIAVQRKNTNENGSKRNTKINEISKQLSNSACSEEMEVSTSKQNSGQNIQKETTSQDDSSDDSEPQTCRRSKRMVMSKFKGTKSIRSINMALPESSMKEPHNDMVKESTVSVHETEKCAQSRNCYKNSERGSFKELNTTSNPVKDNELPPYEISKNSKAKNVSETHTTVSNVLLVADPLKKIKSASSRIAKSKNVSKTDEHLLIKKLTNNSVHDNESESCKPKTKVLTNDPVKENVSKTNFEKVSKTEEFVCNAEAQSSKQNDGSSESEWEDVAEEHSIDLDEYNPNIPKGGVEITIKDPFVKKSRKQQQFDFAAYARRELNRFKKNLHLALHKVHLLCLIAHGLYINQLTNSEVLCGLAFSLIPMNLHIQNNVDKDFLSIFVKWFQKQFTYKSKEEDDCPKLSKISVEDRLLRFIRLQTTTSPCDYCLLFVTMCRVLGFGVRLCVAFHPVPFKATDLLTKKRKVECIDLTGIENKGGATVAESSVPKTTETPKRTRKKIKHEKADKRVSSATNEKESESASSQVSCTRNSSGEDKVKVVKTRSRRSTPKINYKDENTDNSVSDQSDENFHETASKAKKKKTSTKAASNSERKSRVKVDSTPSRKSLQKSRNDESPYYTSSDQSDDFYEAPTIRKNRIRSTCTVQRQQRRKSSNKNMSSDSDCDSGLNENTSYSTDYWVEIYIKKLKRWICVDSLNSIIDKPHKIERRTSEPVTYVLSFNDKNQVTDITWRYASDWMTSVRKLRVTGKWWEETLKAFAPPSDDEKEKFEKVESQTKMQEAPLPKTISEYKNHPLYVLKRHLLKFQSLYPPDPPPLGFIREEAVYARECVHTLHSRETWLKKARSVKLGEQAYKVVKANPKWDKMEMRFRGDLPLDIFGEWQTEKYVPPTAKDGKVPRNEYGNVDLFQPEMLPKGTVHLKLPGLNRVARKLRIDCSPAVIGFEPKNFGGPVPLCDGFIVCEEFKDTLILAWEEEQENIRKREEEKRENRIYGNWKRLIKGLLIREKIKAKYLNTEESGASSSDRVFDTLPKQASN